MKYPKIYLAIDNCFASKRWTEPIEWMNVIKDLGIYYVEASADCECDPLYLGMDYMRDWADNVRKATEVTGVRVANLYSGHGTYSTLGLAHTDERVRRRFLDQWLKPMVDTAVSVNAGLGFFCHAFPESVLSDPDKYYKSSDLLTDSLAKLALYAADNNCSSIGVEQMYSPHQIPWTVRGAEKLISNVYGKDGNALYITIDTGHQSGQRNFLRTPDNSDKPDYMYAELCDSDTYHWLSELGCYSPIIHLQQTDGHRSSHLPFTDENNEIGIIEPEKILKAVMASYQREQRHGMPERCGEIYLTLELFTPTGAIPSEYLEKIRKSVEYWRKFIPEDGVCLDNLI